MTVLQLLRTDRKVQWILSIGLLVQLLFCFTAVGFLHPDQHFQIIEFSSYQLGEPSGATSVWELTSQIRPTLQVYFFSAFIKACRSIGIMDAYSQMTIIRTICGLVAFVLFNAMGLFYFKNNRRILYLVLLLTCFSWTLPYIRTFYSSEMASSVVFFGAVLLYETTRERQRFFPFLLTGFLLALSFYLRFQTAFAIAGFGLWWLLFDKKYRNLVPLLSGFAIGIAINCWLDYHFYHQFVFTPYRYYYVNIAEGKAAEFGTSSFMRYMLMLALVIGAPLLSIFLFYYSLKSVVKQYRQPLVWATVFFVLGHCLVAHKEERFMFPILNVLPIIAGWGLPGLVQYISRLKTGGRRAWKIIIGFSATLAGLALVLLIINPYSQTVEFSRRLKNRLPENSTLYCLDRTPFETESKLPLVFYQKSVRHLELRRLSVIDSVRYLHHAYITTTYNQAKDSLPFLDSLGCKPVFYSSVALWRINEFLQSKNKHTINDIWVLYRKE